MGGSPDRAESSKSLVLLLRCRRCVVDAADDDEEEDCTPLLHINKMLHSRGAIILVCMFRKGWSKKEGS
jgi:hypothetical protein